MNDFSYGFSVRKNKFALASKKCRSKCHFYGKCHGSADCKAGRPSKFLICHFDLICVKARDVAVFRSHRMHAKARDVLINLYRSCFTVFVGVLWHKL